MVLSTRQYLIRTAGRSEIVKRFLIGFLGGVLSVMAFFALIDRPDVHTKHKGFG